MHMHFPASIELHLREAGLTSTDLLVLRQLLGNDALTLRDMARKTGKSTGILDLSVKKLMQRSIIERIMVNDHPSYSIRSLASIAKSLERDTTEKCSLLLQRHKNFEDFISLQKLDRARPEMDYFIGVEGLERAYDILLLSARELLTMMPMHRPQSGTPLHHILTSIERSRKMKNIFRKIITQDSPVAAAYQSKDTIEMRSTLLLPARTPLPSFEKTIAGNCIACLDWQSERACIIRFPALATAEKAMFNVVWSTCSCASS